MFGLEGKVAAVIGAGSGIGRAIAVGFAQQGAVVHCLDVDEGGARKTADTIEEAGGSGASASVDVRNSTSVDSALRDVAGADGRLDILVGTPGINIRKPLVEYTDADYDQVIDVNLRGAFHMLRGAGQLMVAQKSGSIILISSISCREVEPGQVIYAGTKAAVAQMVRVMAAEVGPHGVRVNAISPGPVETALTKPICDDEAWRDAYAARISLGRWADPAELAPPAVFLASDEASYVNGAVLFVDGGWTDMDTRFQGAST